MILEILILILTTILCYYIYSHRKIQWYFKERGVKYVPGWPVFGNMVGTTFLRKHFQDELEDLYREFPDEKYIGFQELTKPIILIRDPEVVKNIVVKDFDHFTDHRGFFNEDIEPLLGGSLLLMKGEKWRGMRTILTPAFTASKMKYMLPFILDITNNIVEYLHENLGKDINVEDMSRRYTNDVIASAAFGLEINSLKDKDNEFFKIGSGMFEFNFRQRLLLVVATQFPKLTKKLGIRLFPDKVYDFFTHIVASTIEYRKKVKLERPDMIQLLMEAKKEWTADEITCQVFVFFATGFESSATTLTMSIHELAINTDVQEKLYQECKKFKEEKELTFENLTELRYMEGVFNETLRKWSPGIILDRICTKPYELPPPRKGGKPCMLQPGDVVYNLMNQLQMDPRYWPEPHKFNPERFLDENKQGIKPFTFMPFGVGPRVCIGIRFAMMELKVLMYHIITNFKIVKTEKTLDPIKLVPHHFSIRAVGGTSVRFEKRSD